MTDQERYRYETCLRMRQFSLDNAADFPPGSVAATQFAVISTVIDNLDSLIAEQAEGFAQTGFSFANKDSAREALRDTMYEIVRTARSMVYEFPNITELFRIPANLNDVNMLAAANAFIAEIPAYKEDFIRYELPTGFDTELQADIDAFEASLPETGTAIDERVAATAEIGAEIRKAMVARRILMGVVKNIYRNNVGKLAAWLSASHIEKAPKKPSES